MGFSRNLSNRQLQALHAKNPKLVTISIQENKQRTSTGEPKYYVDQSGRLVGVDSDKTLKGVLDLKKRAIRKQGNIPVTRFS